MKIETKFDIGQKVWFVGNGYNGERNRLYEGKVEMINILYRGMIFNKEMCSITYSIDCGFFVALVEDMLFATKKEALASLKKGEE